MSDNKTPLDTIREALNCLYYHAYHYGHHDTIEGCYTDVLSVDRLDYHDDAVKELLEDPDMEPLVAALRSMEGSEPVAWMSNKTGTIITNEELEHFGGSASVFTIPLYAHPPAPAVEHAATLGVSEGVQAKLDRANKLLDLRRAQKKPTTIIAWVPEDELPASLPGEAYSALFEHSKVDFIRLFPVFGPAPAVVGLSEVIKAGDATFDAWLEEVKGDGWPEPSLGFIVHKDKWINVTKPFRP